MCKPMRADSAVIFDVDGVLLDLTGPEEDAFFWPFAELHGLTGLSRDWDGYRIRNDEDIIHEILESHFGRAPTSAERRVVIDAYLGHLNDNLARKSLRPEAIPGAAALLDSLDGKAWLGIATANLLEAAAARLAATGLWDRLKDHGFGANGGGAKRQILARAITSLGLPRERIIFIGDNLNDVEAGLSQKVHFIGFSVDPAKTRRLAAAGAERICNHHQDTLKHIEDALQF